MQRKDKVRRVRTGCITCRARKVKCDETPGGCNNCKHRQLVCDYVASDLEPDATVPVGSVPPADRPRQLACEECRAARCRCSRAWPSCSRCAQKNLECVYPVPKNGDGSSLTPIARARIAAAMKGAKRNSTGELTISSSSSAAAPSPLQRRISNANEHEHVPETAQVEPEVREPHRPGAEIIGQYPEHIPPPNREYLAPEPHRAVTQPNSIAEGPTNSTLFNESLHLPNNVQDYVDAFFDYVAPYQANAFLHQGTIKQQLRDGEVPEHLLLAICAISARFVPSTGTTTATSHNVHIQASQWARLATQRLMASGDITLTNAVVALLLCKNATYNGAFNHAFLLASLANRYALKLRLFDESKWIVKNSGHGPSEELRWVEKEHRRRIMFACYCVDRMTATGMKELTFCPASIMALQLPCEDYQYDLGMPCTPPIVPLESDIFPPIDYHVYDPVGIMGYYVCLVGIRYVVLRYIENLLDVNAIAPWLLDSDYQLCLRKLSQWLVNLPASLQLSRDNIFIRHRTPHLGPLVLLHTWCDMLHCELYRLALQTHSDARVQALFASAPTGWVKETQDLCVHHAIHMVRILRTVEENLGDSPGFTILDPSLAMLCYASMKIQLLYFQAREAETPQGHGGQGDVMMEMSEEMGENFKVLLLFVERLARYFRTSAVLLKEMKRTLQRAGIPGPWNESTVPTSGAQTPEHPWLARMKPLEQPQPLNLNGDFYDMGLFEDMIPDIEMNLFDQFGSGFAI